MWQKSPLNLAKFIFCLFLIFLPLGTRLLIYQFSGAFSEYQAIFLYASDIFLVLFLFVFGLWKIEENSLIKPLIVFLFFAGLSTFFAFSESLAVYNFLRLGIAALLALSVGAVIKSGFKLRTILAWVAVSGVAQSILGFFQFFKQSDLGLRFFGEPALNPALSGVAKIIPHGVKMIRAYGTLPHPNVLAAFLLLGLGGLYYFWLRRPSERSLFSSWKHLANDLLMGAGIFAVILGLTLTFSRTGWLLAALLTAAFIIYSLIHKEYLFQGVRLLLLTGLIAGFLFAGLNQLILPRLNFTGDQPSINYRLTYNQIGLSLVQTHPLGIGIGNQVLYSIQNSFYKKFGMNEAWQWQPIHNIYLLMASEIGLAGLAAFLLFIGLLVIKYLHWNDLQSVVSAALLLSLLIFGFFDHFLWTLQPGRLMLWLVMGILLASAHSTMDSAQPSEG